MFGKRGRAQHSLNAWMVLVVLAIMLASGFLTGCCVVIVQRVAGVGAFVRTPLLMPLIALFVSVVLGTAISALVSSRLLAPINSLIEATEKIGKGDFSVRVRTRPGNPSLRDLTDSFNGMAEELGGIEMFRQDFINNFSHEFKTPIVSIRGFARQLKNESLAPAVRAEYTDIIISEAERLTDMAANVLLLSKLENQQIVTGRDAYALDEQLRACVLLLEKQWTGKSISFDMQLEAVTYNGNEEMMTHLWLNLLSNAIKFSHEGGEIHVSCTQEGTHVHVVVRDEGIGMSAQTIRHIFDKFYQGDTAHAARGNGLGLSLVKRIIKLCGGYIKAESEEGVGTSFTVRLPQ